MFGALFDCLETTLLYRIGPVGVEALEVEIRCANSFAGYLLVPFCTPGNARMLAILVGIIQSPPRARQPLKLGVSFLLDSKDEREEPRPKVNIES